ncbi:S8 family peptidase [Thalassobacillus pellis]|uniref:S8 family peptidase n=1 Tax=Thalassobacillus pellis TaxID=748008 RepID=UPI0019602EA3|nr:S8 family serine peptidase [Thalassobacillus pellis]MBM7552160.1 subtilisin [Thalassobacillus pellis]
MKRILLSMTMAILVMSTFAAGALAAPEGNQAQKQDTLRVLIDVKHDSAAKQAKQNYDVRWNFGEKGFTTNVNQKQYEALKKNKNIEVSLVEKVSIAEKPVKTGERSALPSDQTPWGMEAIYNNDTIQTTDGGDNIRVAVLDTGANVNHVDLASNVEQCKDFSHNRSPLIEGDCGDGNGHGTHVAGTVLADGGSDGLGIYGVAPDAKLWAYKVLTDRGSGYSDDIARAITHATDQANAKGVNLVISMSLGASSESTLISDAVTYANNNGVLVVAAAGNAGPDANTIGFPGGLQDAVAVAALQNSQENGTYRVADFSSRGNPDTDGDYQIERLDVEVSAPGAAIESTWNDGGYNTISGTSMATPHISGLAAKIWAENPGLSDDQLRAELQNRATANDILGGYGAATGDDYASGFGFPLAN